MNENAIQKELEALRNDLKQLQADTIKLKDDGKELTGDMVKAARLKLEEETQKLLSRLQDAAGEIKQHGHDVINKAEKSVEENPLVALLAATGIGFAIGILIARK